MNSSPGLDELLAITDRLASLSAKLIAAANYLPSMAHIYQDHGAATELTREAMVAIGSYQRFTERIGHQIDHGESPPVTVDDVATPSRWGRGQVDVSAEIMYRVQPEIVVAHLNRSLQEAEIKIGPPARAVYRQPDEEDKKRGTITFDIIPGSYEGDRRLNYLAVTVKRLVASSIKQRGETTSMAEAKLSMDFREVFAAVAQLQEGDVRE